MLDPVSLGVASVVFTAGAVAARLRANKIEVVEIRGPLDGALQHAFPIVDDLPPDLAHLKSQLDEIE